MACRQVIHTPPTLGGPQARRRTFRITHRGAHSDVGRDAAAMLSLPSGVH